MRRQHNTLAGTLSLAGFALIGCLSNAYADNDTISWAFGGGNLFNTRHAAENRITPNNVGSLRKKWEIVMHGDVSATPTVEVNDNGATTVYAVDWGGYL